ncbi:glycosyltransferase family 4 protein [Methanothermobacter tenebrarum]|uniref:Glycosyltransferase family 1 protein n=1 Tax=Methanothermobacter tenebrarum TaxID=680118 RepID=A0A328PC01_9EURY|nr:glycosyltransferase family 4 protein [Methanothermobacter tenebrarum]MBC7101549.1 glycosyltransferase family 4 protein [Methanobacteriales archaeon]NPV64576.1 glycosyltransferase family 4 protein [Methanobacteriaceae archaeon]RAO78693.1 glycosyltransferase family 1 protein [Methanothermobacter tenebrarum]
MRILIVSDFFAPHYTGGGERRYFEIGKRLVKRGWEVDVICMKIKGVKEKEDIKGLKVHHIGPVITDPPKRSLLNFLHFILAAIFWILSHDYDIIDAQTYAPLLPAFIASRIKRTPMIATIHDVSSTFSDQWIQSSKVAKLAEKILLKLPYDKIVTVSNMTREALVRDYGINPRRVKVIYNGVDLPLIDSIKASKIPRSLIFVGRLAPHKHVDHLLKIVKELKKEIPTIRLKIIGDGVEKNRLKRLVKDYKIEDRVSFYMNLKYSDVIYHMKRSSLLVLPSTREGFGMVLAEANACYRPVIAYKSGGVIEVVEDGENGFLVEPLDIGSLKEKIRILLFDEELQRNLGENGRKKVEKMFVWDKIVDKLLKVYKDMNQKNR